MTAFVNNPYFTKTDTPKNQILIDIPVENGVTSLKVSSSELVVNAVLYPTDQTVLQLLCRGHFLVKISFKDVFGFAEYQQNGTYGLKF